MSGLLRCLSAGLRTAGVTVALSLSNVISRKRGTPVYECVQRAGDIMVLPSDWAHATLNLVETVTVAAETYFDHAAVAL